MLDFLICTTRFGKNGQVEILPKFIVKKSQDLMIRGGDFYAVWVENRGLWSTDEQDAIDLIDEELANFAKKYDDENGTRSRVFHMWDSDSGMIDHWHRYCQKQQRDNYNTLDETLIFSNMPVNKKDYASKRLPYPLEPGSTDAYDKLMSTIYSSEERHKIEWAIGSIVSGDSKKLQKFVVLYGAAGTGKSTVLNIIQMLFDGYYAVFDAKALGSSSNSFALEAFKENPLIAIQHDGDLSRIEDNTRLNSLVSHELMTVNEKFKSTYANRFKCFLFMGTNKPVKITDGRSGLLRRLIDVSPSGEKLSSRDYKQAMNQIAFELGAIAYHCQEVYLDNPGMYDHYVPLSMMGASNDFYNYVIDNFHIFKRQDGTTLTAAWASYKQYCDEAKVPYPMSKRVFAEELKNYFREYSDKVKDEDGLALKQYYSGFRLEIFDEVKPEETKAPNWITLTEQKSIFDEALKDAPAQYAGENETPVTYWSKVNTTLSSLDTSRLHYIKVPENHVVIDFDLKDAEGKKSVEKNMEAASHWPRTYAEFSKSGAGIHLHYIYDGDVSKLSRLYAEGIEVKVFTGNSALRRKLTKCNSLPIATINSGLPLKGDDRVVNWEGIKNEKMLRNMIQKNLNKEYHAATKPSIDYIAKLLDDATAAGIPYDVSDLKNDIIAFAAQSTNQADYCLKVVSKMKWKSEEPSSSVDSDKDDLVFFDCEVFPNLFLVNWKFEGEGKPVVRMINPTPEKIEELLKYRLVGFNCRRYDNHMLYARLMGYTEKQIFDLSQRIISEQPNSLFGEAYNLSYTDIYDFCTTKQSLKKWEIDLGIHHHELGLPWDQPVPEELWPTVAEYCDDDVLATERVFHERQADFMARQIQVDIVKAMYGMDASVNDTTNSLSAKIIFGKEKHPQSEFNYRDLSKPVGSDQYHEYRQKFGPDYIFRIFDPEGLPTYQTYNGENKLADGYSILPFFPHYYFHLGKSYWVNDLNTLEALKEGRLDISKLPAEAYEEIGEGGRVFGAPGMYKDVWDGDVASMHPHSAIFERLFGPRFTKIFEEIVDARVAIKHKDFETAGKLLGGALKPYLNETQADALAQALKIVINSIYGMTSASFDNPFRDNRNVDNIVAKRGALFMTLLKQEVERQGFKVCHIKTDSIKIPDATPDIQEFVINFGKEYGYSFETEANFSKYCLVNNAVYIAKNKDGKHAGEWTAVGAQFAVPYVFKTLFSKEPITFEDLCETKSVTTALYLDTNEGLPDVSMYEKEAEIREKLRKFDWTRDGKKPPKQILPDISDEDLAKRIAEGHVYQFVGKIGQFCPMKSNSGGGWLVRKTGDKYTSVTGAKGYRWMESEIVKVKGKEADVDLSYYRKLVDEAIDTIRSYGDVEWFLEAEAGKPLVFPPWNGDCEKQRCEGCPNFKRGDGWIGCSKGYDVNDIALLNDVASLNVNCVSVNTQTA